MMRAESLIKRFGGLLAVDQVSLTLTRGTRHAVIGPNGAGKSSLINLLSGEIPLSAGQVLLNGGDISSWPAWRRGSSAAVAAAAGAAAAAAAAAAAVAAGVQAACHC